MARHRLRGDQQARANIFPQIDILIRRQQQDRRFIAAAHGDKAVHKILPAFLQIDAPFADGAGELIAIRIHRRIVIVIIRQPQVIDLVRQLINLEDHAVVVHLVHRGESGDVVGNRPAGADQARVIHVGETGVGAFQQRGGGGDILIAPQLTSRQLDEEVGLGQQPGFGVATGNDRHFLLDFVQLFGQRLLLAFGFV